MSVTERLHPHAAAAGVANILLSLRNGVEVLGSIASRREEIDLKGERAAPRKALHYVTQRGVGDEAAIPIALAVDLDRREAWRERAAGHHVLWPNDLARIVETHKVTGAHVDCANAEPGFARVDTLEVDEPFQRRLQIRGIVIAGECGSRGPAAPDVGTEKARLAEHERRDCRRPPHRVLPDGVREIEPIRRR